MLSRLCLLTCLSAAAHAQAPSGIVVPVHQAFQRMYRFDFAGAHHILDRHIAANPAEPLGYTARAAAYLFFELDRMGVLEAEFVTNNRKLVDERQYVKPDPGVRDRFYAALENAHRIAAARLERNPGDTDCLFTLSLTEGMKTDYTAFVEKKQLRSLSSAKKAQSHAVQLLRIDPGYVDAYMTTGVTEYLVGSLPFFLRWFVRFEDTQGSKETAVAKLNQVAASGRYLGPFARILLAIIHLREKRPQKCLELLEGLAREFPENPLFRKELAALTRKHGGRSSSADR